MDLYLRRDLSTGYMEYNVLTFKINIKWVITNLSRKQLIGDYFTKLVIVYASRCRVQTAVRAICDH